ncbi:MAG TPA: benzoyl-CoA reductase subunit C [Vicinamibacteria bacterium]|nr:benzoyl-CoA reductase subunit C [Vicinamibacteria bacterium]
MTVAADPAAEILARCRRAAEDTALSGVRDWKAAHPGGLAIGSLPVYVPRPLFEAIGCLPVALFGGGDRDIIRGDSYFQSYICHIPRSTVELALCGALDALDGVVFPSTCDVIRNLGGMWQLLFPDRWMAYLDLPQNFSLGSGGRFYAGELARIAGELAGRGARPLDPGALREAIAAENDRRALLATLDVVRAREPWRLRATEAYLAARAGAAMPARDHAALLEDLLAAIRRREPRLVDNARVVVAGSFCEQPPLELILTLEKAGCDIVDDDFQLGLRTIEGPITIAPGEDPLHALARAYLELGTATACRYIAEDRKGAALVDRVRRAEADGVVFAAASFCDPALLDQPMLETALDAAGIPHTSFKFAENTGQFQTIREQAGAFSDAVKLWGTA